MNWSLRDRLEQAWQNRTTDDEFQFSRSNSVEVDWLIVDTVRYKKTLRYMDGSIILTLGEETEDFYGNTSKSVYIALRSCYVDELLSNTRGLDHDVVGKFLVAEIIKLQNEKREAFSKRWTACFNYAVSMG